MRFPLATRDDLQEMLLDFDRQLDRLAGVHSVSPDAELRRLESRAIYVRWITAVRDQLAETESAAEAARPRPLTKGKAISSG